MINKIVIKRDNRRKPFSMERIHNAILNAYKDVSDEETFKEDYVFIEPMIEQKINKINDSEITIEHIQDIVVEVLSKVNKTVADSYNDYRKERDEARRKRSKREQFYKEVLQCTNVDNDNANVDQYSFSGRKYRITDYEQKMFALRNLISKEGREAFENGEIYYHDLSSYAIGEFN